MGILDLGYRFLARPVLFRQGGGDAEIAHHRTLVALGAIQRRRWLLAGMRRVFAAGSAPREVFGVTFPNPVGLAAGADKDGLALAAWPAMGFGFVEAGTVTAHPQPGNPQPRIFRLTGSHAVINRMGFPNAGAEALAHACEKTVTATGPLPAPLGISIGKSKIVPPDEPDAVIADYLTSLRAVAPHADYIAVNVSSPNTPGLRGLQDKDMLDDLLAALTREAAAQALAASERRGGEYDVMHRRPARAQPDAAPAGPAARRGDAPVPILVKIAPDLAEPAVDDVLQVCQDRGVAGVIATNTTVGRPGIAPADRGVALERGGLSGAPLAERALGVIRYVTDHTDLPVIGVGGITTPDDAARIFDAGAALVQLYTGMLYQGPDLVRRIVRAYAKESR